MTENTKRQSKALKHLSKDERRTSILATKVNERQKKTIKERAARCGLSVSDYLLMVGCGCEPKARLSEEVERALRKLDLHRSDIRRFFANFNTLNAEERKMALRTPVNIAQWLSHLAAQANEVDAFLCRVRAANRLPKEQGNSKVEEGAR